MTTNIFSPARSSDPNDRLPSPERVLTIGAHPDDAEFGAGGTLAKWASEGCHITMLIVSDGSKGTWDPDLDPEALIAARQAEQRKAADRLGARDIVMLDHVDGEIVNSVALRQELSFWIRTIRPDVVLSHDPWKRYMLHPDHRATGMAAIDSIVAARDHLFFPEQLSEHVTKHRPVSILLWSADEIDYWEDIAATFDVKIAALLEHSTQGPTTMASAQADQDGRQEFVAKLRAWSATMGEPVGLEAAEGFKRLYP
jgi:LmbE family N-acetylglucosaminyl deacetylase